MPNRPNIVLLLYDHQAYYRHGWDGGPEVRRPCFARMATQGIAFSRSCSASPLCGPARSREQHECVNDYESSLGLAPILVERVFDTL